MEARTQGFGTIGWAVSALQHGHRMRRAAWPAGHHAAFDNGQLYKRGLTAQPWSASPEDLLAVDWMMVEPTLPGEYHS